MRWSLAGRLAKWSLFALAMVVVNSPEFYGLPDFTSVCYEGICYDAVRTSPDPQR